jgi:hypothetical protein
MQLIGDNEMLKQTQPYVTVMKMMSGEEFICKVISETLVDYVVSKPLTLGQTQQGVQFIPVMMLADPSKHVTIPKPVIIGFPTVEMESQYESLTTGIALPAKSSIIKA